MNTNPPLILIPGTLCDEALFSPQVLALGRQAVVADITGADTIAELAADVLRSAPQAFAVAGLSLGGIVAAEIVAQAPERVIGLGLLDTNLDAPDGAQLQNRSRWAHDVRAGHFANLVADNFVHPLTNDSARHGQAIFDMAMRVGPTAFLNQNAALLDRHDRRPILETLDVPVLIACGALDQVTPVAIHEELAERCEFAQTAVIPDAGHLSTIDQPKAATRVLADWLQTCITNNLQEGQENNEYNFG